MKRRISFSIIIPWMSRDPLREECLKHTLDCLKVQELDYELYDLEFEVLLMEQSSDSILTDEFLENYKFVSRILLPSQRLGFNKSWCLNVGARRASHSQLIFLDADMMLGKSYLYQTMMVMKSGFVKIAIGYNSIAALPGPDNPICRIGSLENVRAMGGIWYCDRDYYFNELGGMNENFFGYGGEDNDAYERVIHLLGYTPLPVIPCSVVHQYHNWAKPSPSASDLFLKTKYNPDIVIARLKTISVGDPEQPHLIKMEDLEIPK